MIIMTSNVGARLITEKRVAFGFTESGGDSENKNIKELVTGELKIPSDLNS